MLIICLSLPIERQERKLEDLEARHEQQSQELATVNRMYARKSEEAEVATSRFQQTKVELDETAEKLRLTTEQLQQTQERLQEQQGNEITTAPLVHQPSLSTAAGRTIVTWLTNRELID